MNNLCDYVPHALEVLKSDTLAGGENVVAVLVDVGVRGEGVVLTGLENDVQGLSPRGRRIAGVHNGVHIAGADLDALGFFR